MKSLLRRFYRVAGLPLLRVRPATILTYRTCPSPQCCLPQRRHTATTTRDDHLAALRQSVIEAAAAVEQLKTIVDRRQADVDAVTNYLARKEPAKPPLPPSADAATTLLWEQDWDMCVLQRAEDKLEKAKNDWRDAKEDLYRAEDKLRRADVEPLTAASAIELVEQRAKLSPMTIDYSGGVLFRKCNYLCNQDKMFKSVLEAVGRLARGRRRDKSCQPLPCVVGAMGQGKTELLHALMRNQNDILAQIKDTYNKNKKTQVDHVLPLFVTFNQQFSYLADDERSVSAMGSLIARLLHIHLGCGSFTPSDCRMFEGVNFTQVLLELTRRAYPDKKVLVVLLIDEVRKLVDDNTGDKAKRSALLNAVTRVISDSCLHFIPIVSSLEVIGIYEQVTTSSGRPLHPISLPPCPRSELDVLTQLLPAENFLRYAHIFGGHYRTIERLLEKNYVFMKRVVPKDILADTLKLLGDILLKYPRSVWRSEASAFGNGTLWDTVKQGKYIFYADVNEDGLVTLTISPYALMNTGYSCETEADYAGHKCLPLFKHLYRLVGELPTHSLDVYRKHWEMAVPIAEALFGGLTGALPLYLRDKGLTAPAKNDFDVEVVRPLTESERTQTAAAKKYSIDDERQAIRSILIRKTKCVFCPRVPNYPGIDALSTVFSVALLYQMKLFTENDNKPKLESFAQKLMEEAQKLGLKQGEYVGIIDIIGVPPEQLEKATAEYSKVNVFFVDGTTVVDVLSPLIGTYTPRLKKSS